jgi:hypothetical protein
MTREPGERANRPGERASTPRVRAKRRGGPAAVQEALFEVEVRPQQQYYRQILDALARADFGADPLASELILSKLFGTVWAGQEGRRDGATEITFGLALVENTRHYLRPTTVALLRAVAMIAPFLEVRTAAAQAADALVADGLPEPLWSPPVGAVRAGRCWAYDDVFGDHTTMICEYGYGPDLRTAERHAIVVFVDHAMFSVATDIMLTHQVDGLVRDLRNDARNSGPMFALSQVEPARARAILVRGFARTDLIDRVRVEPTFADLRAVAMARAHALPEDLAAADLAAVDLPRDPPAPAARRALVEEFLASVPAQALRDIDAAAGVATRIVDHGCIHDPGQVLRVGPAKWEVFAYDWLPQGPELTPAERAALPGVARAWSAWAGRRMDLPGVALDELAAALDEILEEWHSAGD